MSDILLIDSEPFVSRSLLKSLRVSVNTMNDWRNAERYTADCGRVYFRYSSIPKSSRVGLPWKSADELRDLVREDEADNRAFKAAKQANALYEKLRQARDVGFATYRPLYEVYGAEKARAYAKKHSVWAKLVQLKAEYSAARLFAAYDLLVE